MSTILCVDDESAGLRIRKAVLEHSGYRVVIAESGSRALEIATTEHLDLAIIDFLMPEMTGDELALRLRALNPSLPIIMLSAYVTLPEGALDHCNLLLVKGEPPQRLLDAIRKLLQAPGPIADATRA